MAEVLCVHKLTPSNLIEEMSKSSSGDIGAKKRLRFSSERGMSSLQGQVVVLHPAPEQANAIRASAETSEQVSAGARNSLQEAKNESETREVCTDNGSNSNQQNVNNTVDQENISGPPATITSETTQEEEEDTSAQRGTGVTTNQLQGNTEDSDAEVSRTAREQGHVSVVYPGTVTQEGCCRFVSEILKCVLYQRQQLPMTYDQLVFSQKKRQASIQDKDSVSRRPVPSAEMGWRKSQQTLLDLQEVLQQLEVLFSLTWVPRVLLLMGGSLMLPKEMYEINMEGLALAAGDKGLKASACLRQLFRTLFVADLLSDTRPVRLMPTTVIVLAHRDCGVEWFRPKLQFKVPTRVKNKIIFLSSGLGALKDVKAERADWQDYVWFQAPVAIKGFSN